MGIMYTNHLEIEQLEAYNLTELEIISDVLEDELFEFQSYLDDNHFSWQGKNGSNVEIFERISEDFKNVLFKIKSARTEDFNFEPTDITYFWVLNGSSTRSQVEIKPTITENAIKNWINTKSIAHIHDFSEVASHTKDMVVMRCKCGQTMQYSRVDK